MGVGSANGENRTEDATKKAISSPLLEVSIDGAETVLLNITGGPDLSLFEAQSASEIVSKSATSDVNIIFGTSIDENLGDEVRVTVIATGIDKKKHETATRTARRLADGATPVNNSHRVDHDNQMDSFNASQSGQKPSSSTEPRRPDASEFDGVSKPDFSVFNNDDTSNNDTDNI